MNGRTMAALALPLAVLAAACGGGDDAVNVPRVLAVGSVAENATYAYARDGAAGLYPYLAPDVRQRCSQEQIAKALAGREPPTGFRALKKVDFEGDEARVILTLIVRDHDEDAEWVLVPNPQGPDAAGYPWYVREVPGIEGCGG